MSRLEKELKDHEAKRLEKPNPVPNVAGPSRPPDDRSIHNPPIIQHLRVDDDDGDANEDEYEVDELDPNWG